MDRTRGAAQRLNFLEFGAQFKPSATRLTGWHWDSTTTQVKLCALYNVCSICCHITIHFFLEDSQFWGPLTLETKSFRYIAWELSCCSAPVRDERAVRKCCGPTSAPLKRKSRSRTLPPTRRKASYLRQTKITKCKMWSPHLCVVTVLWRVSESESS